MSLETATMDRERASEMRLEIAVDSRRQRASLIIADVVADSV